MDSDQNFRKRHQSLFRGESSYIKQANKNPDTTFQIKEYLKEFSILRIAIHDKYRLREVSSDMLIADVYYNYHHSMVEFLN